MLFLLHLYPKRGCVSLQNFINKSIHQFSFSLLFFVIHIFVSFLRHCTRAGFWMHVGIFWPSWKTCHPCGHLLTTYVSSCPVCRLATTPLHLHPRYLSTASITFCICHIVRVTKQRPLVTGSPQQHPHLCCSG